MFIFNEKEYDVKVVEYKNVLGKIPDNHLNYSDHEGVYSEFEIRKHNCKGI
jgi:hypothetical protein